MLEPRPARIQDTSRREAYVFLGEEAGEINSGNKLSKFVISFNKTSRL